MSFVNQQQRSKVILEDLLSSDLSLKTEKKDSSLHNTHAFIAKFHSAVPKLFIEALTDPGEVVLDPMCGSGTTLIEAVLASRIGMGLDFDPLGVKLSRMKTSRLDTGMVKTTLYRIANNAFVGSLTSPYSINQFLETHYSEEVLNFFYYWFSEESIVKLASLIQEIQQIEEVALKNFFEIIFSSIIIAPNGGVSLARDLIHSRPQRDDQKRPKDAIKFFLEKGIHAMDSLQKLGDASGCASVVMGDCRNLPLKDNSVDLIVTSPPCVNSMDRVQAHKFSLYWLGVDYYLLARRRHSYIGAQGIRDETKALQQDHPEIIPKIDRVDTQTACILGQYFQDMAETLSEMQRVLKPGKAAIIVVGPSAAGGITVQTQEILGAIGESIGFQMVGIKAKGISYDRRLMQLIRKSNGNGMEARLQQEYIVGLVKSG